MYVHYLFNGVNFLIVINSLTR